MKPIVLMQPYITPEMRAAVVRTLETRWIGQGPAVERFEADFQTFIGRPSIAVSSGTAALHLAYLLAGIKPGDEVVCPLFTCTATNTPLLQIGARIKFCDVAPDSLNVGLGQIYGAITEKTKAVVLVHYGGAPIKHLPGIQALCKQRGIVLIEDCAQAIGASAKGLGSSAPAIACGTAGDFGCFSFQAVKHVTTGDGGMLVIRNPELVDKAKRLRWFGIDRAAKLADRWANDITELGYKYQMTDIAASMGIESLKVLPEQLEHRKFLLNIYGNLLDGFDGVRILDYPYDTWWRGAHWLCTVAVERRDDLKRKLAEHGIESGQVHYRNDRYSIFKGSRGNFPNMDAIDGKYLVLPLHMGMDLEDVERVCEVIKGGW